MTTVKFKRNGLAVHSPEEVTLPVSTTFTESGITPRSIKDLGLLVPTELPLEHGRHKGLERLCSLVPEQSGLAMSDVIVTVGASTGIFIVSVVDEALAEQILQKADELVRPMIADLERRRDVVDAWIQSEELLEWIPPVAGGIGFVHLKRDPPGRTAAFYDRLLREQRTVVAQGAWFDQPDTFFRLGFGYPPLESMKAGLAGHLKGLEGLARRVTIFLT